MKKIEMKIKKKIIKNQKRKNQKKKIEETYEPTNGLIDLVYSKSRDFKTIYKLNQLCRNFRIFIIYFKDK